MPRLLSVPKQSRNIDSKKYNISPSGTILSGFDEDHEAFSELEQNEDHGELNDSDNEIELA
jgi:hypothetical protein